MTRHSSIARLCIAAGVLLSVTRSAQAGEWLFRLSGDEPTPGAAQVAGRYGRGLGLTAKTPLTFPAEGRVDRRRGTVCLWVRPHWDAEATTSHVFFADDRDFKPGNNSLLLWEWHTGLLRFDVRDAKDQYLVHSVKTWRRGEWRHVAAAWDCEVGTRLYLGGDLVASKAIQWEPKPSKAFLVGGKPGRPWPADADVDDLRIYGFALNVGQVQRVMEGRELHRVRYMGLDAPAAVTVGQPFDAALRVDWQERDDECQAELLLDDSLIASVSVSAGTRTVKARAAVPHYLYPAPGKHTLTLRIRGALGENEDRAQREVVVRLPAAEDLPRSVPAPDGAGLWLASEFLTGPAARGRSGSVDAVPCRLVDAVDCTKTDHGYWENAPATVEELAPGRRFRCVGPQDKVTQVRLRRKREHKALAAFSYRLECKPRPTPHLVVVESINDAERYLEVAIDHPRDSRPAAHLAASGCGRREAIHLSVTYTGREYSTDAAVFRQAFMIFPKTDAVEVAISGTARGRYPDAKPAAVSRIEVYEVAAPLARLANPLMLPEGQPQRTVSIFFPAVHNLFEKYGFTYGSAQSRASTLRLFVEYMRFMGVNRFEFRPFLLSERALFKTDKFEQSGDLDIFAEALPIMGEAGIQVVPRVMYLHSYHKLLEDDPENFQHSADGKVQAFGREGPIPDPLRPPVQKVVLDSIQAFLDACEGHDNVPSVGFDTSIGGLYWNRRAPTSHTGYSQWNVAQFAKDTGTALPGGLDTPKQRFDWLKAHGWDRWITWRCRRWHAFVAKIRDMAQARGKTLELSVRVMPREEFWTDKVPIREIYRYTGYDPALFAGEAGIRMDYFIRINSDRYFGRPWWKPWFYDPRQPELFLSKEPRHVEMYFNYWELPFHPWGFRVGPGSPVGRNFFEPLTYAVRTLNPHDVTFFCWFRASIGREMEIREFARAFRALPAVEPRDFDGRIEPQPADERLWVKWFGDRLAVVNDSDRPREVTLRIPRKQAASPNVFDAAHHRAADARVEGDALAVRLTLRPFDMRTLVFLGRSQ